ncbi:MAG: toprim domain-containing protein, partial [Alphaproteobacteria bacterium]|nr:toprim domain-containing protein [Alphaproteobacteria bacterium]
KGAVLYNFDKARGPAHEAGSIIAVEGYIDVIAMHRAGLAQAVAPLGTALTENQLALLWRAAPEPILCFDGDAAGLKAAYRALDLALPLLKPGHSLKFAFMPGCQDPDDLLKAEGPAAVRAVVEGAQPLSDVLWQRALADNDRATPERRAQFERDLRAQVAGIGDETVRKHYVSDLAARLAALWQPPASGQRRRSFAAGEFRPRRMGRGFEKPWEVPAPASPQLRALARAGAKPGAERRLRMILLSAVNHPELLHEFLDDIAFLEIAPGELGSLRSELIESAGLGAVLDRQALRSHLSQQGLGPVLDRMEAQARRLNEWFLGSAAAQDDARTGLRQMIALHRKSVTLDRELRAAEAAFAEAPTEDNLNALNAVREQLSSHAGAEAQIDGFGQASGRPAGDIT